MSRLPSPPGLKSSASRKPARSSIQAPSKEFIARATDLDPQFVEGGSSAFDSSDFQDDESAKRVASLWKEGQAKRRRGITKRKTPVKDVNKAEQINSSLRRRERMAVTRANAGPASIAKPVGAPSSLKQFHVWMVVHYLSLHKNRAKLVSRAWGVPKPTVDKYVKEHAAEARVLLDQLRSPGFRDGAPVPVAANDSRDPIAEQVMLMARTFRELGEELPLPQ